jgi:hypothetical protein
MTPAQINELLKNAIELAYETETTEASIFFTMGQLTAAVIQLQEELHRLNTELDEVIGEPEHVLSPGITKGDLDLEELYRFTEPNDIGKGTNTADLMWDEIRKQQTLETDDDDAGAAPGADYIDPDHPLGRVPREG